MTSRTYPADTSAAGLRVFLGWFGGFYARSLASSIAAEGDVLRADVKVGRRWTMSVTLLNTVAAEATIPYEAARAGVESKLDAAGLERTVLWVPRGAELPLDASGADELVEAVKNARAAEDGRLEVRRPVDLKLRRASREGSVVTVLGGLSSHWAQFTSRVPGSFQLNSQALNRLPQSEAERTELTDRIVMAAGQPDVDEGLTVAAEDCWTATAAEGDGACVIGSPLAESDEASASLRRNTRRLLKSSAEVERTTSDGSALVLLGAATYADDEKLSWALRGMDPALYAGYDIVAVIADGVVKPLLIPNRGALPWDAPLG
ncbi:MAG: hypothetical protein ACSLFM_03095 [Tepidiformaceae bacterium]